MNEEKSRVFTFRTFASSPSLARFLEDISDELTGYKYILHDKDDKKPHFHGVIKFEKRKRTSTVIKLFSELTNEEGNDAGTHIEKAVHISAAIRYLTHNTAQAKAEGKFQYSTEDVISFGEIAPDKEDSSVWFEIVNDVKEGASPFELVRKYGFKYVSQVKNLDYIVSTEIHRKAREVRDADAHTLAYLIQHIEDAEEVVPEQLTFPYQH